MNIVKVFMKFISKMLHRSDISHWPKRSFLHYSDDNVEVVQAVRTLKFWIRFKVGGMYFVFWHDTFDVGVLQQVNSLVFKYRQAYMYSVSSVPDDILPLR